MSGLRRLRALRAELRALWRRAVYCRRGIHRDTVEPFGGYALRQRCLDCGWTANIGWVVPGSNKLHTLWPWEREHDS